MATLIIVRHGQSSWNLENRFTGDVDVDLTPVGISEAEHAGELLKKFPLAIAFTSVLKRAIHTLEIILKATNSDAAVTQSAALNERRYGDLQGLNKKETEDKYGASQVLLWRRSFAVRPPNGESLEDTLNRVAPYFDVEIKPHLRDNANVIIVAHGNSLRALMMHLEKISPTDIEKIDLATGVPKAYEFAKDGTVSRSFYVR